MIRKNYNSHKKRYRMNVMKNHSDKVIKEDCIGCIYENSCKKGVDELDYCAAIKLGYVKPLLESNKFCAEVYSHVMKIKARFAD